MWFWEWIVRECERVHVHIGCMNYACHTLSKELHIWKCEQKADKSVLVVVKWWTWVCLESKNRWMTTGGSVCLQLSECWRESRVLRIEWKLISKEERVMYCWRMGKLYALGSRQCGLPSIRHRNAKLPLIVVRRYFKVYTRVYAP